MQLTILGFLKERKPKYQNLVLMPNKQLSINKAKHALRPINRLL